MENGPKNSFKMANSPLVLKKHINLGLGLHLPSNLNIICPSFRHYAFYDINETNKNIIYKILRVSWVYDVTADPQTEASIFEMNRKYVKQQTEMSTLKDQLKNNLSQTHTSNFKF